ncbi:ATP-binding protein [Neptunicoccus cionae]|uniref:ATP-binding protein n=1 Tax=Neptunicoccus cionae TaxID=2035344 RepID=UPI000C767AAE|nr:ATP-binding protein [Amylibacter cionae]PLS20296.1 two-component sensor histidine kinase [Amylibacter cionae]
MFNKWLKPYLPRSLFGRAFMILAVPIVLIQVVVGVVFVERLFQDVSRQMTQSTSLDLNHLIALLKDGQDTTQAARDLQITLRPVPDADLDAPDRLKDSLDFSGRYVIETLRAEVPEARVIDLASPKSAVTLIAQVNGTPYEFTLPRQRVSAANPHQLLVAMVAAAIFLTALAAAFLRNQISPVRRLARAADAFGKGQSLPLYPRGASEVRAATNAFLSMRSRIERQIEQRTLMLSGVSHDLRTPLTRLKLSLSLLDSDDEETTLMARDLDEMEDILNEFLAFAKGDSEEQDEMVSPLALAEQVVANAERGGRVIPLNLEGAEAAGEPVKMRRPAVQRAIANLLSNAAKYGDRSELTLYTGAGFVEFVVEDNGPGIHPDQRETAVKPFARLDTARNQDKGSGVGLGLAIAADIARSHGGSLNLGDSERLGGLKAAFRLPR